MQQDNSLLAKNRLAIKSFQSSIEQLKRDIEEKKRQITEYQQLIKEYTLEAFEPNSSSLNRTLQRKPKEGGWISKITAVLSRSENLLTSRQILDQIYELFPDLEQDKSHMGSLSSALNNNSSEDGLDTTFIKVKRKGEFATFGLSKNEL